MLPAAVANEYPPPPLIGRPFAQTAIPYSILFVVGTLGNTAVLAYVFFITRSLKSSVTALGNTFVYIVALCAVDLLVTVSIPFSLSNTILNNWVFGEFGCKLHWAVELSNKMCSTFILTALAFDRYMAICHPENKRVGDGGHSRYFRIPLYSLCTRHKYNYFTFIDLIVTPLILSAMPPFASLIIDRKEYRQSCVKISHKEFRASHGNIDGKREIHQMRQTIFITIFLALLSIALIMPVVFSATVRSFTGLGKYVTQKEETYEVVKYMCVDGMRRDVKLLVVGFLVVFAFVLPCSLLTFFYSKIILRLRRQQRTMLQSRIPIRRITIYTMAATLFYLSCQIPFWLPQIYGIMCMVFGYKVNPSYITLTYYSHLLPFVSASFNWIFYARLNSQFKKGLVLVTERLIRKRTK
ncbi:unnamed protein product [Nippostrongylus brasiliensis]|uniref:G_PROTEIN_RECEP_F1_2 domain-containing protein n=1 Tax=Nippostrongylus brasiliensis TaxID=27835 RepID=A0A158QY41_NIPBR|nr:unnamed protein product [Nippostrongylus brasiliensis]